ncbi:Uncharacterised protein [Moraxella caviae]|uniref:Uncharacterized protein n=1 Tax=Moraxella caviae TaxID=34060 RepID=A0A378R6C8_9GAMM|nr:Uncharacterised protein [Moraxella caviae]VEW13307.1 Uncharacterised protein [Moraxella caviae]
MWKNWELIYTLLRKNMEQYCGKYRSINVENWGAKFGIIA